MQGFIEDLIKKSKTVLAKDYLKSFSNRVVSHFGNPHELTLDEIMLQVVTELKNNSLTVDEFFAFKSDLPINETDFSCVIDDVQNFILPEMQNKLETILAELKNYQNNPEI